MHVLTETEADRRVLSGVVLQHPVNTTTWPGLVDAWLRSYKSAKTRDGYLIEARRWTAWCEQLGVTPLEAQRPHADQYLRALEELGEANRTQARRLSAVSSIYRYAVSVGTLERNPLRYVRRPVVDQDQSPTIGITQEEAVRLLHYAAQESARTGALVALLLGAGLRVSEALEVRAENRGIDRGHRFLKVVGKGDKERRVPLHPQLQHAIDQQLRGRTEGFILATRTGRAWDRSEAWRAVKRLAKAAELEGAAQLSPHSLRHTAATLLLDKGVPLARVQQLLGHKDPRTTQRYNRKKDDLPKSAGYELGMLLAG
ncbi:tyrosine-type recombinase/integrase [Streptomyces sp. JNUCC 63]